MSERIAATQRAFEFIMAQGVSRSWRRRELLKPLLLPFASELEGIKQMGIRLPHESRAILETAMDLLKELGKDSSGDEIAQGVVSCLLALRPVIDSVVEFNVRAARIAEKAFAHLQRLIVVDDRTRQTWGDAFLKGETACERLGATHLLWHGIWAFKAYSEKERTDLVFGELLSINDEVRRASTALVLTEWKKVSSSRISDKQIEIAKEQAKAYTGSSLAGFELDAVRFLVMVSEKRMEGMPKDIFEDGVTYRCINIAVDPPTPGA